jgi:hypothetical protein
MEFGHMQNLIGVNPSWVHAHIRLLRVAGDTSKRPPVQFLSGGYRTWPAVFA